jgi:putative oxidoreductase
VRLVGGVERRRGRLVEVGIVGYHAVFDPSGLAVIAVLVALTIYLAWSYRAAFAPMLRARVEPTAAEPVGAHRTAAA